MKSVDVEKTKVAFTLSEIMLREIDAAWVKSGCVVTRSEGIRWLIRKGLKKVEEDGL